MAIDILAFQRDIYIHKRLGIFLPPLIYLEFFVCVFFLFVCLFALDKGGYFPSLTQSFSTRIHDSI